MNSPLQPEGLRLLVIEDDPDDALLLEENLTEAFDREVRTTIRPGLASAAQARDRGPFDLVLLDLNVKDSEGTHSLERLRAAFDDVPIIVVTNTDDDEAERVCIVSGAQDYITKSDLSPRALRRAIVHAIERHQLQATRERALALERELAGVVRCAQDAIVTCDRDGRILSWSPGAETIYGYPAEEAIGRDVDLLVPEALRPEFLRARARLLEGESIAPGEAVRLHRAGHSVEVEESLFAIRNSAGQVVRLGSIARDQSQLARLSRATEFLSAIQTARSTEVGSRSPAMRHCLDAAELVASDPSATVLILGETGTGKGWLARHIHRMSARRSKPFLEINGAGLAPQLVESELFGHEKGAFTGAVGQKRGLAEAAEGGTLFLDEIGELPLTVQAQLLTFLDTKTFRRVGGTCTLSSDVRLVAATNLDLRRAVEEGRFRRDLYFRLSIVPIQVPPLRERVADLPALAADILRELGTPRGRTHLSIDPRVLEMMKQYSWPGNVRELRNTLERALILGRGDVVRLEHLSPEVRGEVRSDDVEATSLSDAERSHILRVLDRVQGNRTRAAELLGVSRSTLKRKLAEMRQRPPA